VSRGCRRTASPPEASLRCRRQPVHSAPVRTATSSPSRFPTWTANSAEDYTPNRALNPGSRTPTREKLKERFWKAFDAEVWPEGCSLTLSPAAPLGCPGKIVRRHKGGNRPPGFVLAGLSPAVHAFERPKPKAWIRGSSPRKTTLGCFQRVSNRLSLQGKFPRTALRRPGKRQHRSHTMATVADRRESLTVIIN